MMYVVVHWTESLLSVAFTENSDFAARVLVPHSGLGNLSLFFRCTVRSVVRHLSGEPRFDGTCCSLLLAAARCCLLSAFPSRVFVSCSRPHSRFVPFLIWWVAGPPCTSSGGVCHPERRPNRRSGSLLESTCSTNQTFDLHLQPCCGSTLAFCVGDATTAFGGPGSTVSHCNARGFCFNCIALVM
ncbi:hypothetical protein BR93DRAFT_668382 [Coniochaeta sp. PMI_546]|nr:hypothetical protein BR93DRAFT_668382 [Coniochaeta sp. PMI_546]